MKDQQGYFHFKGQAGDNFRWQSENISVEEIETTIKEITGIKSFMYYGVRVRVLSIFYISVVSLLNYSKFTGFFGGQGRS